MVEFLYKLHGNIYLNQYYLIIHLYRFQSLPTQVYLYYLLHSEYSVRIFEKSLIMSWRLPHGKMEAYFIRQQMQQVWLWLELVKMFQVFWLDIVSVCYYWVLWELELYDKNILSNCMPKGCSIKDKQCKLRLCSWL